MALILPRISKLIFETNGNEVWHYFEDGATINNLQIVSVSPFVIESSGIRYLLTNDKMFHDNEVNEYVLLTSRRPTRADLNAGKIIIKRWLKHPHFQNKTPDEVLSTWNDKFKFVKENEQKNIKGFRPPQVGALYSILAHIQNPEDKAIVVMPAGTGKTETMLATLISNCCKRLLVSVPSDSLRTQISEKFITLGLLKEYGRVVDAACLNRSE